MNDIAETITAQNTNVTGCRRNGSRSPWLRPRERQCSMWPVPVVVIEEHLKDPLKVLLVQNQEPVETFLSGRCARTARQPHSLVARDTASERSQCPRSETRRQNDR